MHIYIPSSLVTALEYKSIYENNHLSILNTYKDPKPFSCKLLGSYTHKLVLLSMCFLRLPS